MDMQVNNKKPSDIRPDPTGACFLTTATVEALGLPDNCEPLELARFLRDNQMSSKKERSAVELYYDIAPEIVSRCNDDDWAALWSNYIRKITALVKLGEYGLAKEMYTYATAKLVSKKITRYSDEPLVNKVYDYGLHGVGRKWLPYWARFGVLKAALFVNLSYHSIRLGVLKRKFKHVLEI